MDSDSLFYDVLIVGAGPSGLSTAIHLKQLAKKNNQEISVCILEKGSEVGSHIISGAVLETGPLETLFPNWKESDIPVTNQVQAENFFYYTRRSRWSLPVPAQLKNSNNYIISLGQLCKWLAKQAEALGVDIFPGFPAAQVIYNSDGFVSGIETAAMGLDASGEKNANYQPGLKLFAGYTVVAEGCRGSLSKKIIKRFRLDRNSEPQTYGLGFKEVWKISEKHALKGHIMHGTGWPVPHNNYGGSFLYHMDDNLISLGMIIGLDYQNPWLSPYDIFQQFKTHPAICTILENAKRISYGARTVVEGGYQSLPLLTFPGGLLVGDSAGFLNVLKIKGTHMAMQSGILAAESIIENTNRSVKLDYNERVKKNWLLTELHQARNIRPAFNLGRTAGLIYSAFECFLLKGRAPWTLHHQSSCNDLKNKSKCKKIEYPEYDEEITFNRLSSLYYANISHRHDQPCHLNLADETLPIMVNYRLYASPEIRYCPAGVYELIEDNTNEPRLQINAQNCLHCKACDIKDPTQNITWMVPEGGSGPNYSIM